ncbi:hypothetical protein CE91St36_07350 [Christensenellaceae bacterium]|nr:hypothetical protein CE91St36_07350 [Christensenellaceae bacterium]BDF60586.1 hypothetical protein CE91St37_07360 [Christensenellaceae bacterium]
MKIKFLGKTSSFMLTYNKIYNVLSIERGYYRILNDYLYPPDIFEIIDNNDEQLLIRKGEERKAIQKAKQVQ